VTEPGRTYYAPEGSGDWLEGLKVTLITSEGSFQAVVQRQDEDTIRKYYERMGRCDP
jgi:hypothetical protein